VACTTNPAYCSKLLTSDRDYLHGLIDGAIRETGDNEAAAVLVYQRASRRLLERFRPLYEQSEGTLGFVTMQDDPRQDQDTAAIVRGVHAHRALGPNYMAKIPVIPGGLEAIEACVEADVPICATEIFALTQAVEICERYERAAARTGRRPPLFVTHISGIFDEYLEKVARREGIQVRPEVLAQAGCAMARRQYRLMKARRYPGRLLGGGARGTHHFTEMVGGDVHVTINWSTAQEIMDAGTPVAARMDAAPAPAVVDELCAKFPDFAKAYQEDGLPVSEFAEFGPVQLFRNAFLKGWHLLLAEVAARRNALAL
jgi:transaldolase